MFFTYINSLLGTTLGVRCCYCYHFIDEEGRVRKVVSPVFSRSAVEQQRQDLKVLGAIMQGAALKL